MINPAVEACRPANNPWGTFVTTSDDRCSSLLITGDPAACTERTPAAVDSIDITTAANVINLAAVDTTVIPGMKLKIQDASGRTCLVAPKNTDLRVASVTETAIAFMSDLQAGDADAATNCVVTGLTGCSYTPPPSSTKEDPADTDAADCLAIGSAGTILGENCDNHDRCTYNDQGTTSPSCGVSYATVCQSYGVKTREGAMPTRTTDHAAGGACIEDADRDVNTHPDPRCEYVDGGTVQSCVPIDSSASQTVIDACLAEAPNGEDACTASGDCAYTANDISDDYCVALNTGVNALSFFPPDFPLCFILRSARFLDLTHRRCTQLCQPVPQSQQNVLRATTALPRMSSIRARLRLQTASPLVQLLPVVFVGTPTWRTCALGKPTAYTTMPAAMTCARRPIMLI